MHVNSGEIGVCEDVGHKLFYTQRITDSPQPLYPDAAFVEGKTPNIARELLRTVRKLSLMDAKTIYRTCSSFPATSVLGGLLFERIATMLLSIGNTTYDEGVFPMFPESGESPVFVYTPSTVTSELLLPSTVQQRSSRLDDMKIQQSPTILTPRLFTTRICPAVILEHVLADRVTPSSDHLLVPRLKTHSLFDIAFFVESSGMATLYVLQMTTSARFGGTASGYDAVRTLRDKFISAHPGISCGVKYVLVVPVGPQERITWITPSGWGVDATGEVFVQFLDIEEFLKEFDEDEG